MQASLLHCKVVLTGCVSEVVLSLTFGKQQNCFCPYVSEHELPLVVHYHIVDQAIILDSSTVRGLLLYLSHAGQT